MKKTTIKTLIAGLFMSTSLISYSQIINTFAGSATQGFSGDGGPATDAELFYSGNIGLDASGNVYFTDIDNERVRKVNTAGIITTFAGNGATGYSGDGGPATAAEFHEPGGIALDPSGNVYITDDLNARIRMVNTSGIIVTFAGNGVTGYSGDGGPATAAEINQQADGVAADAFGNIYIADSYNNCIRKVTTSGIISTIAGNGTANYYGDGGPATAAELNLPIDVGTDAAGNIYIGDFSNNRVRKVNTSGIITTIAGNGVYAFSGDGGQATAAEIAEPWGVTVDASGNIYFGDSGNNRVRKVNTSGIISTIAGNGTGSYSGDGGPATASELYRPLGVYANGPNLYIADEFNSRVRIITGITTEINEPVSIPDEITVYPIPNKGIFTVTGVAQRQIIELYNYTGEKILSAIPSQPTATFDISNYANGIYLIRILNKNGSVVTKKVLKTD